MKLLIVTDGIPTRDPVLGDGSSMISFEIIRSLPADTEITLVTLGATGELPEEISARCVRVATFGTRRHAVALFRSLFSRLQVGAEERSVAGVRARVRELSAESEVTLLHGPHIPFVASYVRGPMVVQVVDPWSMRMEMEARHSAGLVGAYKRYKARRVFALEQSTPPWARLLTVGREDASRWSQRLNRGVRAIANGVDHAEHVPRPAGPPVVCFVGSLNYAPNIESATILVEEIAPLVWRDLPETRFTIAGRQPGKAVTDLRRPGVEILPNVPSIMNVFTSADVAVFPDKDGLGIRNSVREALAAGIPVVATAAAAREVESNESLTTAEDPEAIAAAIVRLLRAAITTAGKRVGAPVPTRSWKEATTEYLDELELARAGLL
ncbi:MAG TPA: glycosyltransferase [Pseudolysinimonas sp.]|nr:glycosyltransferase [Pseudolysinimonas sp.]